MSANRLVTSPDRFQNAREGKKTVEEQEQRHLCLAGADHNRSIDSDSKYPETERIAVSDLGKAFHHPHVSHSHL